MKVTLKGVHCVTSKGHTYWYAWRGGPRLRGQPGSPEFHVSYNEAIANQQTPEPGKFRSLVTLYKKSDAYEKLAASTKEQWGRWLDRIADHFGDLRIAQFNRPEKIRPYIRQWRNRWADVPRTADMGMQVLSVVMSYGIELGNIASNPCEGIKRLYSNDRSEIIWTDEDVATIKKVCSPEVALATDLAAATGLRRGDLLRLCWSHVRGDCIVMTTSKSQSKKHNRQRDAIIPLYDELREILARIPKRSTTILTNSQGRPWTDDGFSTSFNTAKKKVGSGLSRPNLHFHDLRGTAVTKFYVAGIEQRVIAEIVGWTEGSVAKIIHKYVDRSAAIKNVIRQLNEKRK
jgi:integrase